MLYYKNKEIQLLFESEDLLEIDYLLKNGLDVNSLNYNDENAALYASHEKLLFLEKHGLNLFHTTLHSDANLLFNENLSLQSFKYLINKGVPIQKNNSKGYSILPYINIEKLEFLEKSCNYKILPYHSNKMSVFTKTEQPIAEILYKKYKADPFLNNNGYTSLYFNKKDTLEYLINLGVDYSVKNSTNVSVLYSLDVEGFKYLTKLGMNPIEIDQDYYNQIGYMELSTVKYIVEDLKIDIFDYNQNGKLYLYDSYLDTLDYLVKKGALENLDQDELIQILLNNDYNKIHYLLSLDCYKQNKIHLKNQIYFNNEDELFSKKIIEYFINNREKNKQSINILHSYMEIIEQESKNLLLETKDYDIMNKLIEEGININFICEDNSNVLFYNFKGIDEIKEFYIYQKLINKGIDIHLINNKGENCLFYIRNINIIQDLIKRNINIYQKNNTNSYFLEYLYDKKVLSIISNKISYQDISVLNVFLNIELNQLQKKFKNTSYLKKELIKIFSYMNALYKKGGNLNFSENSSFKNKMILFKILNLKDIFTDNILMKKILISFFQNLDTKNYNFFKNYIYSIYNNTSISKEEFLFIKNFFKNEEDYVKILNYINNKKSFVTLPIFKNGKDIEYFKEIIDKRKVLLEKIPPIEELQDYKNNKNENILFFIQNTNQYHNCKKDYINLINQYGENPLFYHIKKLHLFYKTMDTPTINDYIELILELIKDTNNIIEYNYFNKCIYFKDNINKENEILFYINTKIEQKLLECDSIINKSRKRI